MPAPEWLKARRTLDEEPEERPTVVIKRWFPPRQYNQPHLEPDGDIREKEIEVLGEKTVIQNLGENAERFNLRGDAWEADIKHLRTLRGQNVDIRHPIHSGPVLITGVSASHTGSYDTRNGHTFWVYTYNIDMVASI